MNVDRWQVFEILKREYSRYHQVPDIRAVMSMMDEVDYTELEEGYQEFYTLLPREGEHWLM